MKKAIVVFAALLFVAANICGVAAQTYSIQQYLSISGSTAPRFSRDGVHIAFLSNASGTSQIWSMKLPSGTPKKLTDFEDNVSFFRWIPDGSGIIFGKAKGGDENTQFYWIKPDGTGLRALTDEPGVRHNFGVLSENGEVIAYASNKRNRNFFDIYAMEVASGKETLLYQQDGNNSIAALHPNGSRIIISRDRLEFSLDNDLFLYDVKDKKETLLTPHKEAAQFGAAKFLPDGKSLLLAHNDRREFYSLANLRLKNAANSSDWSDGNREIRVLDPTPWDVSDVELPANASKYAYALNREGFSEVFIGDIETDGKPLVTFFKGQPLPIRLPGKGIVSGLEFNHDQTKLAFAFASAARNPDIWIYDLAAKTLVQATHSGMSGISPQTFIEPRLIKYKSFDGREISGWYYEPSRKRNFSLSLGGDVKTGPKVTKELLPVIVSVHGGPEGQERPGFNPLYQYYLSRGYAVLATNVRGSTGYGKTFTHLDDVAKREDSVKDLAFAAEWLKAKGGADPKRIAVVGGSYGGYMTMAAITLYPDLWAAAVATVAITNWETFLTNTSGYRRRQREVEYGRLDRDIEFLRRISPIRKIDSIKTPLFVISGRNDPRVPYTEGEQMVNALKKRGAPVQYKLYDDEGHGISKLKNRLELYPLVADFLDANMNKK